MDLVEALTYIREIPDFPSPGILFRDITPLLAHQRAFERVISELADSPSSYNRVVGVEARGFILGSAIALHHGAGFIPVRKSGKLPHSTIARSYGLEYGEDVIEVHVDALSPQDRVLIVDDVLATGGTLAAAISLVKELGAEIVDVVVLFEIAGLGGRELIKREFPEISLRSLVRA